MEFDLIVHNIKVKAEIHNASVNATDLSLNRLDVRYDSERAKGTATLRICELWNMVRHASAGPGISKDTLLKIAGRVPVEARNNDTHSKHF